MSMRLLLLAFLMAPALLASDIQLFGLTNVLVTAIALLGLNLLVGYNGQISLGHGAFYALGAYAAAVLVTHFGAPHWAVLPAAALASLAAGLLLGFAALGLSTMPLAVATLALGAVLPAIANHRALEPWTGGASGMALGASEVPFALPLGYDQWLYLLALGCLAVLYVLAANLLGGRIGRAVIAIRDHPVAAQAAGIDAPLYKAAVFGVSAMYVGVAGALSALSLQYVAPGIYGLLLSFSFLVGIAVGGIATLSGALYGALFLQLILMLSGATARSMQTAHVGVVYGAALILVIWLAPGGIAGLLRYFRWYWSRS